MSDRQQQRAEAFAIDLGIGMNQARTVLREFARLLHRQRESIPAGRHAAEQRLRLEHSAAGDAEIAAALAARLGCSAPDGDRFARAAAFHFLDAAECDAAESGRRPAACLVDELRAAGEWLSKGEQYEVEQALWKNIEQRALALGTPELLTSKDGRRQLFRQAWLELRQGGRSNAGNGFPLPGSLLHRGPW